MAIVKSINCDIFKSRIPKHIVSFSSNSRTVTVLHLTTSQKCAQEHACCFAHLRSVSLRKPKRYNINPCLRVRAINNPNVLRNQNDSENKFQDNLVSRTSNLQVELDAKSCTILLLVPDTKTRNLIRIRFGILKYKVVVAESYDEAITLLASAQPVVIDLVIIHSEMPYFNGYANYVRLRQVAPKVRCVLILSPDEMQALGEERVPTDYVLKPFSPQELEVRTQMALVSTRELPIYKAPEPPDGGAVEVDQASWSNMMGATVSHVLIGPVLMNFKLRTVYKAGVNVSVTPMEFEILKFLALNSDGDPVTKEELKLHVDRASTSDEQHEVSIRRSTFGDSRAIVVHIRKLRAKLENEPSNPSIIMKKYNKSISKFGYLIGTDVLIYHF